MRGHPCFALMRHVKMADMPCNDRTAALSYSYRDSVTSNIFPMTKLVPHLLLDMQYYVRPDMQVSV